MSDVLVRPGLDQAAPGSPKNLEIIIEEGAVRTTNGPTTATGAGLAPTATETAQSSVVLKAGPGNFYGANCTSTVAGYLMLFDAVSVPADGTVTPKKVWSMSANSSIEVGYFVPLRMNVGITLAFSATGPFTKTAATAFMSGEAL